MLPYGKQQIDNDDIDAVVDVLRSTHLTQGPKVDEFEQAIAFFCDAKKAVATNSGTSALHIACLALGLSNNDIVWSTPLSFVASTNCALYCGATIDFVDVELATGNMDIELLSDKLAAAKLTNSVPKIIIVVHLCGQPCAMEKLARLAQVYQFKIIEDACHGIGGQYQKSPLGSGQYSDITVFSFHPVKNMTTAEGGIALTNCDDLAHKMRLYSSHGISKDPDEFINVSTGDWYYEQQVLGYNYRMSDLSAALGLSQLKKLPLFLVARQQLVKYYKQHLAGVCDWLKSDFSDQLSGHHLFVIQVPVEKRNQLFNLLRQADVWVQLHYMNIASQPYYRALGFDPNNYQNANVVSGQAISLPLYPSLTNAQQDYVISIIKKGLSQ